MVTIEENDVIPNFIELIEPHMICDKSRIMNVQYSRLNKCGDKNKSTLFKVEVKLINATTGEDWMLSLVAKLPNISENTNVAQIQIAFQNEIGVYMSAKPAIEAFLREKVIKNGADFFATSFGGRIHLNGVDTVHQRPVLVLQNYSILGFQTLPRRKGLDLESSKLLLKSLAKFHGSSMGLKFHKPKDFKEKVKPYLHNLYMTDTVEKITRVHLIQVLKEKDFHPDVIEKAVKTFDRKSAKQAMEPWATFIHNNTSVNNIMIRCDKPDKPKHVKLLDFSRSEYNSPLRDVLFFLFSSVELGVLKTHLDDLLDYYYYCWISVLRRVDIEEGILFCRLTFNKELKGAAAYSEFYKILCMLYSVLATSPIDLNRDNIEQNIPELQDDIHKKRICHIVREFKSRGWFDV